MPLASFNLNDPTQRARAFHWSNLRPMWSKENIAKKDSIPPGFSWCTNRQRWVWGPPEERNPDDAHHENIELGEAVEELEYILSNEAEDADDEDEDAEPVNNNKGR